MNASDIEIKVYSVGQLRNWLTHGDEDDGLSIAVISHSRADAIVHNPYVKEDDPVVAALFAANEEGNRAAVAYTAAFPDLVDGNRKWWFSTLWCHPDYRGKGYALAVVGTLAEEYGEGNYYDSIGADETVEIFRFLKLNTTYVDEYRFGSKVSPHGWKGALNGLRQQMLAYLRTVNRRAKGMIRRSRYELEYTHRVDNEIYNFIMQHASESLFVRTQSMLDWILNHPFKQRSPLEKRVAYPGAFSDTDSRYWMCGVKVLADNRLVGFYILRNADTDLSNTYSRCGIHVSAPVTRHWPNMSGNSDSFRKRRLYISPSLRPIRCPPLQKSSYKEGTATDLSDKRLCYPFNLLLQFYAWK